MGGVEYFNLPIFQHLLIFVKLLLIFTSFCCNIYILIIIRKGASYLIGFELDKMSPVKETMPDTARKLKVTVLLFGSIRAAVGKGCVEIEIASDCGFYGLLRILSSIHGNEFQDEIFQQTGDNLRDDLIVSINGLIVGHSKLKGLQLHDGAAIALSPNFSGGG